MDIVLQNFYCLVSRLSNNLQIGDTRKYTKSIFPKFWLKDQPSKLHGHHCPIESHSITKKSCRIPFYATGPCNTWKSFKTIEIWSFSIFQVWKSSKWSKAKKRNMGRYPKQDSIWIHDLSFLFSPRKWEVVVNYWIYH